MSQGTDIHGTDIHGTPPRSIFHRPVQVTFGSLVTALGKGMIAGAFGHWPGALSSGVDALKALGLGPQDVGAIAWMLVTRSLLQAMSDLVKDYLPTDYEPAPDFKPLCEQLDLALKTHSMTLTADFFEHPKSLNCLSTVEDSYRRWLQTCGISRVNATAIAQRLPSHFVFALNGQWRSHPDTYGPLKEALNTPFTRATVIEQGQLRYNAWLQKQVEESMFAEPFGLKQVYVPLRAWYHQVRQHNQRNQYNQHNQHNDDRDDHDDRDDRDDRYERVVVELKDHLQRWLEVADSNDAIRVISGGPGSGKSSFAKMFAAHLAEQEALPVLFVPLHQFDPKDDLIQAIGTFITYDGLLEANPLQLPPAAPRRLIIFDGLDELAMQGKLAKEVSRAFVREVKSKLEKFNQRQTLLQVIISGREPVVQDNNSEFRQPHQILHLLPHFLPKEKRAKDEGEPYVAEDGGVASLLTDDRRQLWWQRYGVASGKGYAALPEELDRGTLVEITAQPLLNYLVALSYDPDKPAFFGPDANLNQIYRRLLDAVYERGYERQGTHRAIRDMAQKNFVRILEEVALATWHGDGRTTTVGEIQQHCDSSGLKKLLEVFEEGAEAGVTRLLMAFYFRQSHTVRNHDRTFEFTHKSFGEYLTACRIVRAIKRMQRALKQREDDLDEGWDEREALEYWANVCGPSPLDKYVLGFLRDEIRLQPQTDVAQWQVTLVTLFGFMLRHGMPMEKLPLRTFREMVIQSRHGEETLLATLNAVALALPKDSLLTIDWPSLDAMGTWLARLQGQRLSDDQTPIGFRCLGRLNLSHCILIGRDLRNANLHSASLRSADLRSADLRSADLSFASLRSASLRDADLRDASLRSASLRDADLRDASLRYASLRDADLRDADLRDADLSYADLSSADLRSADLSSADLRSADLSSADLRDADLSYADLRDADLRDADLRDADLRDADLRDAILLATDFRHSQNLTIDQLSGENLSYLCNVALPDDIIGVDPNRDCDQMLQRLIERYNYPLKEAQQMVEEAKAKTWN